MANGEYMTASKSKPPAQQGVDKHSASGSRGGEDSK